MSTVESFFDITFTVIRPSSATATGTSSGQALSSGNDGVLRPITRRSELFNEDNFGKEFALYGRSTVDIKAADTVVIESIRYGVQGVSLYKDPLDGNSDDFLRISVVRHA